jgi:hypothetical protein
MTSPLISASCRTHTASLPLFREALSLKTQILPPKRGRSIGLARSGFFRAVPALGKDMLEDGGSLLLATKGRFIGPGGQEAVKTSKGDMLAYHYYERRPASRQAAALFLSARRQTAGSNCASFQNSHDAPRRHPHQHSASGARRRGGDDRGTPVAPSGPCRPRRLCGRAADGWPPAYDVAKRNAVGAFGVPHPRGEREPSALRSTICRRILSTGR